MPSFAKYVLTPNFLSSEETKRFAEPAHWPVDG